MYYWLSTWLTLKNIRSKINRALKTLIFILFINILNTLIDSNNIIKFIVKIKYRSKSFLIISPASSQLGRHSDFRIETLQRKSRYSLTNIN